MEVHAAYERVSQASAIPLGVEIELTCKTHLKVTQQQEDTRKMLKGKEKNISQNQTFLEVARNECQFSPGRTELITCKPSADFFKLFLNTSYASESALKTAGITKPLTPVLRLHPKRQTQEPKKRFMVDKYISKNPAEQSHCPSVEQTSKRQ